MATTEDKNKRTINGIPLEKIVGGIECPKDYKCTRVSFEDLCSAKDIGKEGCLECLERKSCDCPFMIDIGYARLCRCPLRVYIAKNLSK